MYIPTTVGFSVTAPAESSFTPYADLCRNQLTTAQLLLEIEVGDASFRLDQLREFLERNL